MVTLGSTFFSCSGVSGGDSDTPSSSARDICGSGVWGRGGLTPDGTLRRASSKDSSETVSRGPVVGDNDVLAASSMFAGVKGESASIRIRLRGLGFAGE